MRPMQMDYFVKMEEQGSTMAMDVDDVDPLEMFSEAPSHRLEVRPSLAS
ncbi:unnamed protein product [Linum tenue]|uniref:Uncharacterized protein n=1 Tax=Linum tenue TaxID=586396 RepID=A0AAV0NQH8_9ROSI|nr:unnamed protein product [Linum tenue]